jgi:RNA polymerase sigma-70 factor (ECF subfamily)
VNEDESDEVLAHRAAAGDADAFRILYDRYKKMVFTLALRTSGSEAAADDVLQETFLRVHRALPRFRGDSKLSTWIWRVALSVALTERKSAGRRAKQLDDGAPVEPASPGPPPDAGLVADDEAAWVRRHLEALPRRDRAILHLRYGEGRSFEEVAEMMNMPVGTAKSLVFRAKAELRRNMERDGHAM